MWAAKLIGISAESKSKRSIAANAASTEWAEARHATVAIADRMGGVITVPNSPWHFSDAPGVGVGGIAKYRGEDNRTVLADLLGYDDERLDALESDGVLSSRIPT